MQAQAAPALWKLILYWFFAGSQLVGLPPGERDPRLISAAPPGTIAYYEWAASGPGQPRAAGIDGFVADPEVRQFMELLDRALKKQDDTDPELEDIQQMLRIETLRFARHVITHPGCLFLTYEPAAADKSDADDWIARLHGFQGAAILSLGDDTDAAWTSLLHLLNWDPEQPQNDAATQQIPLPWPGFEVVAHCEANRIIFTIGDSTLPRTIAALSGKQPGLDSNPRFREALGSFKIARISTVGWIDGQGVVTAATNVIGPLVPPLLTLFGMDGLNHVVRCSGVDQGNMIERTYVATGGQTSGVMSVFSGTPIQPSDFGQIPADADLVFAAKINLKKIYQEVRQIFGDPRLAVSSFDEAVKQLEAELNLKIVDDVLPAFGDVVTAFDSPSAGGVIASSLVVSLEVRDASKAEAVFDRLIKLIEQSLVIDPVEMAEDVPTLHRQEFLGHTIHYLNRIGPGYGIQWTISPTFCLTQRQLLFAVHPQAMKAQLRFLDSLAAEGKPSTVRTFDKVAEQKVSQPSGDPLIYFYLNGPRAAGIVSAVLPYISPTMLLQLEVDGIALDSGVIPSAAAIVPYFGDTTAVLTRQKQGLFWETRNAPPLFVALGLLQLYRSWTLFDFDAVEGPFGVIIQ